MTTRPLPPERRKPHPRALTGPLDEQPPKIRRARAKIRALQVVAAAHPSEYRRAYRDQLEKVGLA